MQRCQRITTPCNSVERVKYLRSGSIVRPVSVLSGDCSSTRDSGDILSVDDTSDVVQCSDGNGSSPPCNFVRSVEHLRSGSVVQPVAVLSGDCSSTRDSGDILSLDDTSDAVQCSARDGSPPSRDSAGFDLITIRPITASQLEQTETLRTQLSSVSSCQTEDGHSLDGAAAVYPVLRRELHCCFTSIQEAWLKDGKLSHSDMETEARYGDHHASSGNLSVAGG